MKTNNTLPVVLVLIGVAVVFLIAGFYASFLLQENRIMPGANTAENSLKILRSDLIPSIVAFGQIKNISGRTVTLSYDIDTLVIDLAPEAKVFISGEKEMNFSDLKVGDYINISLKVYPDDTVKGSRILRLMGSGEGAPL